MNKLHCDRKRRRPSTISLRIATVLFACGLTVAPDVHSQEVVATPPPLDITPPAVQAVQAQDEYVVFTPRPGISTAPLPIFDWGPVIVHPHLLYRFLYGDNIASVNSNHLATGIHYISPGCLFQIGRHWSLDYTPTWAIYTSKAFHDTLEQDVRLIGGTAYEDWIFGLLQGYSSTQEPLVQTGAQTEQENFYTALTGSWHMNSSMSLDLSLNQNFTLTTGFEDTREWSTLDWLNYQFWPGLDAGFGAGFGYVNVSPGSDMIFERIQGRTRWRATEKVAFSANGGVELRQVLDNSTTLVNPIGGASVQYQPFDYTQLSLNFEERVDASYFQNQVNETTTVSAGLNQRLLEHFNLSLLGGYNLVRYVSSTQGTLGRNDDYLFLNVSLNFTVLKRGGVRVFYQYSDNSSSVSAYSYASNQGGIELTYAF